MPRLDPPNGKLVHLAGSVENGSTALVALRNASSSRSHAVLILNVTLWQGALRG